ncbi:MAG: rhamnulokinase [Lachnospiraceae bacterium]|nr:rhamnulokinase [Lachnospiraceae bacterium]
MEKYFLAIDIGASNGRHILGSMQEGKIVLEEVYRFPNGMENKDGTLCWDTDHLFSEILAGMKRCKDIGKIPDSVGIDTWGVDYVLLDKEGNMLGKAVGYRDHRTDNMDQTVYEIISEEDLYARTGIQKAIYNTIYQLMALKKQDPETMEQAAAMLMIPDYFHYRLCGSMVQEYSEATTSQLVDPVTKDWDYELIKMLGFNRDMFQKIQMPGTAIGFLTEDVKRQVGYDCRVVLPPAHDTASAVMAVPSNEEDICYISSGTWSLMGVERADADCSKEGKEANFTNEGGYNGQITYLTNIMGLWMIQSIKRELAPTISYKELCEQASKETIETIVDCQDDSFLSPENMVLAIQEFSRKTQQQVPETLPELAAVVYNSLARCYAAKFREIEKLTGKQYGRIHIIGGGSNAVYLNELTARYTGVSVHAGPGEATAIGNILTQMIHTGIFRDLAQARACVASSFEIQIYK